MPNIEIKTPTDSLTFHSGMTDILVPLGVPQTAARLYGYFLLSEAPVSLDRIVDDLEISKSTASVAAHLLEMYTLVRRSGQRGTRRVLFEPSDDYSGMIMHKNDRWSNWLPSLRRAPNARPAGRRASV